MSTMATPHCVLMTTDAVGGVWNYALELCRGLADHNVHVVLATMGPVPRPTQRAELLGLDHVTLCESDYRLEWMQDPWVDVERAGWWLLQLEERFSPDVIHLNGYVHAALPWRAPTLVVAHSCMFSWWRECRRGDVPPDWRQYGARVRQGLRAAGAVVAPTRTMLEQLIQIYGSGEMFANMAVVPNARRSAAFSPGEPKRNHILSVGRLWDEAKNAQVLAEIAPQLPWRVQLAGDARAPDGAVRAIPNVDLLGHCAPADLVRIYARAAIYASPARYEPFGLSILEAALSGCALVLGDIPSLREVWGDDARFVAPDDRAAWRQALLELIEDAPARRRLGTKALARAREFSVERMVAGYRVCYDRLLRLHSRTEPGAGMEALPA